MPSSLDEWWSTRFEQPRVQSYSGASPRGPPGAETFSACCSAMNDSAVQKDSGLYAGRVADSRVAVRQRNSKHVPSRLAHVDDPETRRLQEEEIKAVVDKAVEMWCALASRSLALSLSLQSSKMERDGR